MILVLYKCCSALIVTVARIGRPFSPQLRVRASQPRPLDINLRLASADTPEGLAFGLPQRASATPCLSTCELDAVLDCLSPISVLEVVGIEAL